MQVSITRVKKQQNLWTNSNGFVNLNGKTKYKIHLVTQRQESFSADNRLGTDGHRRKA